MPLAMTNCVEKLQKLNHVSALLRMGRVSENKVTCSYLWRLAVR